MFSLTTAAALVRLIVVHASSAVRFLSRYVCANRPPTTSLRLCGEQCPKVRSCCAADFNTYLTYGKRVMGFVVRAVMAASPARAAVRAADTFTCRALVGLQLEAMYDELSLKKKQVCLSHASSMLLSRHYSLTGMVGGLEEPQ
jgi:hypothetical protein